MFRNFGYAIWTGIFSYGIMRSYTEYDIQHMRKMFYDYGKDPKSKSMWMTALMTSLFGGVGMLYASPRTAIPFVFLDVLTLPIFFVAIFTRPIEVAVALMGAHSHNKALEALTPEFEQQKRENARFWKANVDDVRGRYKRNPYITQ